MDILEDVSKTTVKLIIKEPFYGHYFTHIQRQVNSKIDRLTISFNDNGIIKLEINPEYWQGLETIDRKIGSLKHQILHLIFKHVHNAANYGDQDVFGVAADLVVNQYLVKEQLDPDAYTLDSFKELNLRPRQSLAYYYNLLKHNFHQKREPDDNEKGKQSQEGNATKSPGSNPLKEHLKWKSLQDLSGAESKLINDKLDQYLELSANRVNEKDFALLPDLVQEYIKEALERLNPSVNWKRLLRLFAESSRKTYLKNTIKKTSKRYGTIPGIKIKQRQKILVAIDTSGSVSEEEFQDFFSEIYHVYRQSSDITILECDVSIHNQYEYKGVTPTQLQGRGGTNFDAPIEFANKSRYDLLIYFTDGHAPEPSLKSRIPIIWVITIAGIEANEWSFLPGRKIKMTQTSSY